MEDNMAITDQLCMLCCYSFKPWKPKDREKSSSKKFLKFCEYLEGNSSKKYRSFGKFRISKEKLSVCPDCLTCINSAVEHRERAMEVEKIVSQLQRQLLRELRGLQEYMAQFGQEMKKVQNAVKISDENCLRHFMDGLHLTTGRRGEVDWLRKNVFEVGSDLQIYQENLNQKLCTGVQGTTMTKSKELVIRDDDEVERIRPIRNSRKRLKYISDDEDDEDTLPRGSHNKRPFRSSKSGPNHIKDGENDNDVMPQPQVQSQDDSWLAEYLAPTLSFPAPASEPQPESESGPILGLACPKVEAVEVVEKECDDIDFDFQTDFDFDDDFISKVDVIGESEKEDGGEGVMGLEIDKELEKKSKQDPDAQEKKLPRGSINNRKLEHIIQQSGIDFNGLSKLKKNLITTALKRMEIRKRYHHQKKSKNSSSSDPFWYRKEYIIEYTPEIGLNVHGVPFTVNEEEYHFQCGKCSYRAPFSEDSSYDDIRYKERNLYRHILGIHLKCFVCKKCKPSRTFKSEWRYRDHLKFHKNATEDGSDDDVEDDDYNPEAEPESETNDDAGDNEDGSSSESEGEKEFRKALAEEEKKFLRKRRPPLFKRQYVFPKLPKITSTEIKEAITEGGIDFTGMSKFRKDFIIASLKRMQIRKKYQELKANGGLGGETKDENDHSDDFWYRKEYILEYNGKLGFHIGEVEVIVNEEEHYLQCGSCSYRSPFQPKSTYEDIRYKERNLYRHVLGNHLNAFHCAKCVRTFRSEWRYRDHMRYHRFDYSNQCDICGKPLCSSDSVNYHKFTHMNEEEKEEARRKGLWKDKNPTRDKDSTLKLFPCPICQKQFKTKVDCYKHTKIHDEKRETTICPTCGKEMLTLSYEIYHKKFVCHGRETELPRVKCSECEQTFKNQKFLKRHYERTHSLAAQQRPFQCEQCGKGFKTKESLSLHTALHNDKFDFSCHGCGKLFCVRRYWKRHELTCPNIKRPGDSVITTARVYSAKKKTEKAKKPKSKSKKGSETEVSTVTGEIEDVKPMSVEQVPSAPPAQDHPIDPTAFILPFSLNPQ